MKFKNNTNPQAEYTEQSLVGRFCLSFCHIFLLISFIMPFSPGISIANQSCSDKLQAYKNITKQIKYQKSEVEEAEKDYEKYVKKQKKRNRRIARRNRRIGKGISSGIPMLIPVDIMYGEKAQRYQSLVKSYNLKVKKQAKLSSIYNKCVNDYKANVIKKYKGKGNKKENDFEKKKLEEWNSKIAEKLAEQKQYQKSEEEKQPFHRKTTIKKNKDGVWTN